MPGYGILGPNQGSGLLPVVGGGTADRLACVLALDSSAGWPSVRVVPVTAFGLIKSDFIASPTRWSFIDP